MRPAASWQARRRAGGATLLEVLVALVVLGLAAGALLPELGVGRQATERARERVLLAGLSMTLLDRVGNSIPLREGQVEGTEEVGGTAFAWHVTIQSQRPEGEDRRPEALRLFRVGIALRQPGDRAPRLSVTTLRVAP